MSKPTPSGETKGHVVAQIDDAIGQLKKLKRLVMMNDVDEVQYDILIAKHIAADDSSGLYCESHATLGNTLNAVVGIVMNLPAHGQIIVKEALNKLVEDPTDELSLGLKEAMEELIVKRPDDESIH